MRHSDPRLTMNRYTRANQSELDKAATRLPVAVPKSSSEGDSACTKLAQKPAGEGGSERVTALGNAISLATAGNGSDAEKQANRSDLRGVTPIELESHLRDLNPGPPLYERDVVTSQNPSTVNICDDGAERLALLLALIQADANLARLVERWPTLPKETRDAILALLISR